MQAKAYTTNATDLVITEQERAINIDVLENDADVDADLLTVTSVTRANHETVAIDPTHRQNHLHALSELHWPRHL